MKNAILIALSLIFLIPNFINIDINEVLPYDHKEQYDPNLSYLRSMDGLEKHVDSLLAQKQISRDSVDYVVTMATVIRERFYHGFSHFTLKENWIAAVGERLIGYGLASKVIPEDIMNHPYAACSQQAMVMMELLKQKKLDYRSVGFPHHFALEVLIGGKWYYFDTNMEPHISNQQRLEASWGDKADNLKPFYDTSRFKDLDWKFGKNLNVTHGKVNQKYARNVRLFQAGTSILSKTLWLLPLLIVFYRRRKKKK